MNVLIIAPHTGDEVLGCGGTISRLIDEDISVYVAIVTKGMPPNFTTDTAIQEKANVLEVHEYLGITETFFLDFPALGLDTVPHNELNESLQDLISSLSPEMMFIPFVSDLNKDSQQTFFSSLVSTKPDYENYPKTVYAYETLSNTNWNASYLTTGFQPNVYFDISDHLTKKLKAFSMCQDKVMESPHERSLNTLKSLAILRGSTVYKHAAEAFVMIREVV